MNIIQNEFSFLNTIFRSVPLTLPIGIYIIYYGTKSRHILYLFLGSLLINFLYIPFIKKILSYLGNYLSNIYGTIDIPVIGRFKRPEGAANCGVFYIDKDNISTTSGMPSGHCILTAFTCIYLYHYITNKYDMNYNNSVLLFILLMIIVIYMAYTRVLFNCHTLEQTIIGTLMGIILGHYYYKSYDIYSKYVLK